MSELSYTEMGEIIALIENLDCDFLEIEYGGMHLRIGRNGHQATAPPAQATPTAQASQVVVAEPEVAAAAPAQPAPAPADIPTNWHAVEAPMVGTFYRAPSPDKPPYVQQGDTVEVGQTIGLIEVMKLFTELRAEVAGTVAKVDATDGALVEFGQPLLWIEES